MKVLFLGDIVGKPGRAAVRHFVPVLRERHGLDLCVGNSENSAGGAGITPESADDLLEAGLDLLTGGNHTWSKREILPYLDRFHERADAGRHRAKAREEVREFVELQG